MNDELLAGWHHYKHYNDQAAAADGGSEDEEGQREGLNRYRALS